MNIEPACNQAARDCAVSHRAMSIDHQHYQAYEYHRVGNVFCLQMNCEKSAPPLDQADFWKNRGVGDYDCCDSAARSVQRCFRRHQKQMSEFAGNGAAKEQ